MRKANDRLYDNWGLKRARWALRPGGILGVWSGAPDRKFKSRLQRSGFAVDEQRVHASGRGSGPKHVVWLGTRTEGQAEARDEARGDARGEGRSEGRPAGGAGPRGPAQGRRRPAR